MSFTNGLGSKEKSIITFVAHFELFLEKDKMLSVRQVKRCDSRTFSVAFFAGLVAFPHVIHAICNIIGLLEIIKVISYFRPTVHVTRWFLENFVMIKLKFRGKQCTIATNNDVFSHNSWRIKRFFCIDIANSCWSGCESVWSVRDNVKSEWRCDKRSNFTCLSEVT